MNVRYIAAVDLGASSGRVMLATYTGHTQKLTLEEIHRFDNQLKVTAPRPVGRGFPLPRPQPSV